MSAFALLGEAFLLLAFVLLAAGEPRRQPADPRRRGGACRHRRGAMPHPRLHWSWASALKMGLVPLHVWMPLAYTAAPIPAAAVLSGAVVKAGVIGLIRFLPFEPRCPAGARR